MVIGMIPVVSVNAIGVNAWADANGQYGDTIEVTGYDVTSGYDVKIYWDSVKAWNGEEGLLNTTEADNDGTWLVEFDVPEAAIGTHYVWVEDVKIGETKRSAIFTVQSLAELSSSSGLQNDEVTVNGYGIADDVEVAVIMVDNSAAPTLTTETNEVGATGDAVETEFEFTLDNAPIDPTSVTIDDGVETFTDAAGAGVLTGDAGGSGTINYVTGEVDIEFNAAPAAVADNIVCDYDWYEASVSATFVLEDEDMSDELGSVETDIDVPLVAEMAPGDYEIVILDADGNSAAVDYTIGPVITLKVEEGPTGYVVEVDGRGFTIDGYLPEATGIAIRDDDATYAAVACTMLDIDDDAGGAGVPGISINDEGEFTCEFVVPWTWTDDDHTVTVTDAAALDATADFEVTATPEIELDVAFGTGGAKIMVTGSNFPMISGESVDFELWNDGFAKASPLGAAGKVAGGDIGGDVETTSNGGFSGTLTIPAFDDDTYQIVARMDDYNIWGNTTFRITLMVVVLSDESGPSGSEVIITGSGFETDADVQANITDEVLFDINGIGAASNSFSSTFFVPTLEPGVHTIVVRDQTAEIDIEVEYEVTETTYMEIDPMVAPNDYWIEIVGENYADDELGDAVTFELWNETEEWDIEVVTAEGGAVAVTLDDAGNFTGFWNVWADDDLDLGTYWINATDAEGLKATIELEIVEETQDITPKKAVFSIGDIVAFDIATSFEAAASYIEVEDPDGDVYWVTNTFDTGAGEEWIDSDDLKVVPHYKQTATNGQLMELGPDAPLGEYSWTWYDNGDDEIDSGVFTVEAAAESVVGEQVADLNNEIMDLAEQLTDVAGEFTDVKSDIADVAAVAEQAVEAANAAADAVTAVAATANTASEAAADAATAAEAARDAASGLTTLVYGAIGAALVAALAAIVSLMQISRRIAG